MPRDACATGMCNGKCGAPMEHGEAPIPRPCLLAVASRERRYLLYAQRINSLTLESLHLESISARANTYMRAERAKYRVLKTWSGSTHLAFGFAGSSLSQSSLSLARAHLSLSASLAQARERKTNKGGESGEFVSQKQRVRVTKRSDLTRCINSEQNLRSSWPQEREKGGRKRARARTREREEERLAKRERGLRTSLAHSR